MFRILAAVVGVIILLGWTFGALTIYASRRSHFRSECIGIKSAHLGISLAREGIARYKSNRQPLPPHENPHFLPYRSVAAHGRTAPGSCAAAEYQHYDSPDDN
jgi:hypothetical protein